MLSKIRKHVIKLKQFSLNKAAENMLSNTRKQVTKHVISVKFDIFFGLKRQAWHLFSALRAKLATYLRR